MDQNAFMPKENEELKFFYFLKNLLISQNVLEGVFASIPFTVRC